MLDLKRNLMPTDTKQLTKGEVFVRFNEIQLSESHLEEWKNEVARDLNELHYWAGMSAKSAAAFIRIVERIAESEEIDLKGKPNV
jgi:hypothetical protein